MFRIVDRLAGILVKVLSVIRKALLQPAAQPIPIRRRR
jgi:hypothetical protein